jgi:hypothetical protein
MKRRAMGEMRSISFGKGESFISECSLGSPAGPFHQACMNVKTTEQ